MVQSKTKRRVFIPCTTALTTALNSVEPRPALGPILTTAAGRPWTEDAFAKAWAATMKRSGIAENLHFHDLRGTAVTMLAEAGCTVPEIATITGHSLASVTAILDVYLARTQALAHAAVRKLDEHLANRFAKRPAKRK